MRRSIANRRWIYASLVIGLLFLSSEARAAYLGGNDSQWLNNVSSIYYNLGNVGLGLSNPSSNLHIKASADIEGLRIITSNYSPFVIRNAADTADLFRIDQNGNITSLGALQGSNTYWNLNGTNLYTSSTNWKVGIGTTNPGTKFSIIGVDNKDSGPITNMSGSVANQYESGRIRFTETDINAAPYYQGGFIHYNGQGNSLNIGVHETVDSATSSDVNAITIIRGTGNVGINMSPAAKFDLNGSFRTNNSNTFSLLAGGGNRVTAVDNTGVLGGSNIYLNGGNVGIGITNPGKRLTVGDGTSTGTEMVLVTTDDSGSATPTVKAGFNPDGTNGAFMSIPFNTRTSIGAIFGGTLYPVTLQANGNNGLTLATTGNVGIGTTNPEAKLDIRGSSLSLNGGYYHYKNLISFNDGSPTATGTLKIVMPKSWSSTMMSLIIKGYNYSSTTGAWEVVIGGYNYSGSSWVNTSVEIRGKAPFSSVRLGYDGTNNVILLGNTSTVWSYPKAEVTDFFAGHSNLSGWGTGWSMAITTDESTITNAVSPAPVIFTSTGSNVGIGNTNPAAKMDVVGSLKVSSSGTFSLLSGTGSRMVTVDASGTLGTAALPSGTVTGSGTTGYIPRWASVSGLTNSVLFDNGTNVGVGTTVPGYKLDVQGNGTYMLRLKDMGVGGNNYTVLRLEQADTVAIGMWGLGGQNAGNTNLRNAMYMGTQNAYPVRFVTNDATRLSIDATGNVGIGETNPINKLTIVQSSANLYDSGILIKETSSGEGNRLYIGADTDGAYYRTDYSTGGNLSHRFYSYNTERMRLDGNGNVGIGTTNPSEKLDVAGNIRVESGGSIKLYNPANSAWNTILTDGNAALNITAGASNVSDIIMQAPRNFSFQTGSTGYTAKMTILQNGNVGIGTTNPGAKLQITTGTAIVGGAATYPGDLIIQRGGNGGGSQSLGGLEFNVDSFADGYGWKIISDDPNNNSDMPLIFASRFNSPTWSDRMTITRTGSVGIGTTDPQATLAVNNGNIFINGASITSGTPKAAITKEYLDSAIDAIIIPTISTSTVIGTGTANYIPKWTADHTQANSLIYDNGTNVGIGNTNPSQKLSVSGNLMVNSIGSTPDGTTGTYEKGLTITGGNMRLVIDTSNVSNGGSYIQTRHSSATYPTSYYTLALNPLGGNVGIGTSAPLSPLEIRSLNNARITINRAGNWNSSVSDIKFNTNDTGANYWLFGMKSNGTDDFFLTKDSADFMTFKTNGYVGIGTTTPTEKLEVNGKVKIGNNTVSGENFTFVDTAPGMKVQNQYGNLNITPLNAGWLHFYTDRSNFIFNKSVYIIGGRLASYDTSNLTLSAGGIDNDLTIINTTGNIGIGTTTPQASLAVNNGNIFIHGASITSATPKAAITKEYLDSAIDAIVIPTVPASTVIGTGTANYIPKWTAEHTQANSLMYDDGTNVGIGTTTPLSRLNIAGGHGNTRIRLSAGGFGQASASNDSFLSLWASEPSETYTGAGIGNNINGNVGYGRINTERGGSYMRLLDYGVRIGTVDSVGTTTNVINIVGPNMTIGGVSSPTAKLDINGSFKVSSSGTFSLLSGTGSRMVTADASGTLGTAAIPTGLPTGTAGQTLRSDGTNWLSNSIIYNNGANVGVGTTNPLYKFTVSGGDALLTDEVSKIAVGGIGGSGNVVFGSSGIGTPANGVQDYGFYSSFNSYRGADGLWYNLRTNNIGVKGISFSGGYTNGFKWRYQSNDAGTTPVIWNDLMTLTTAGSLGIGTTDPQNKLEVSGGDIKIIGSNSSSFYKANDTTNGVQVWFGVSSAARGFIGTITNHSLGFRTNNTDRLLIDTAGNVGIGTTAPQATLAVNNGNIFINGASITSGTPKAAITKEYLDSALSAITASDFWKFTAPDKLYASSTEWKVGIGTTNPGTTLTLGNNKWISAEDAAGTGYANMFRINAANQIEIGSPLLIGPLELTQDGGALTFIDMPVSSAASAGTVESYTMKIDGNNLLSLYSTSNGTGGVSNLRVGIGTTNPSSSLHVVGNATISTGLTMGGDINLGGNSITNINKLTVNTIDPLYNIKGINYSTYASAIVGGVNEEYVGRVKIDHETGNEYEAVIRLDALKEGSDLWVWRKVVDFSPENVQALITPYGSFAKVYYEIEGESLIFRSDRPAEISYRLIGKRQDWRKWPTKAVNQEEKPGFIID